MNMGWRNSEGRAHEDPLPSSRGETFATSPLEAQRPATSAGIDGRTTSRPYRT
jgi:hypothetical protein